MSPSTNCAARLRHPEGPWEQESWETRPKMHRKDPDERQLGSDPVRSGTAKEEIGRASCRERVLVTV